MIWQRIQFALLVGAFLAAAGSVRAEQDKVAAPATPPAAPPCSTPTIKVCVNEWVPETYQCTRTVYKTECRQETYTTYKCECVPQTCTRTCVTYQMVPECRTITRNVCEYVPCVEERTVMKTFVTCVPVTCTVRKCVDQGHYECREVPCGPSMKDRVRSLCHRNKNNCCNDCCEPCCPVVRTKTVRVWVPCKVWVECPVTTMKKVCECRPVTCKVNTCKRVVRQVQCQVTCCKCVAVPKTETYTVMVTRKVPCQATRTVAVCVPCQETVTKTRMVCRTVVKEIPCVSTCCDTCCNNCCTQSCCNQNCCVTTCCSPKKRRCCR